MKWLKSHVPEDGSVFLSDVTSLYTALNVIGPKAKYLLAELSDENFNDFARMTCRVCLTIRLIVMLQLARAFTLKEIDVGFVSHIYAMRLTHTGEDGFMLYIPSEVTGLLAIFTILDIGSIVCFVRV
jgi:pyruvate dehydrogenase phosphatase regulatory subunit